MSHTIYGSHYMTEPVIEENEMFEESVSCHGSDSKEKSKDSVRKTIMDGLKNNIIMEHEVEYSENGGQVASISNSESLTSQ